VTSSEPSLAKDSVNQVIVLSSGILGFSLTFVTGSSNFTHNSHLWLLKLSWGAFVVSLICGVVSLSAIAGKNSMEDLLLRAPWLAELITFAIGLITFTVFGFLTV
jgi:hypothetical protein